MGVSRAYLQSVSRVGNGAVLDTPVHFTSFHRLKVVSFFSDGASTKLATTKKGEKVFVHYSLFIGSFIQFVCLVRLSQTPLFIE